MTFVVTGNDTEPTGLPFSDIGSLEVWPDV